VIFLFGSVVWNLPWIQFDGGWNVLQVERHLRKLDQEVAKFKMELEADNAGITEILEKSVYRDLLATYTWYCSLVIYWYRHIMWWCIRVLTGSSGMAIAEHVHWNTAYVIKIDGDRKGCSNTDVYTGWHMKVVTQKSSTNCVHFMMQKTCNQTIC